MLEVSDEILTDSKRTNWGNNLAGQIKEEPLVPPELVKKENLLDFFGNMVQEYVHQCNLQQAPPNQHQHQETVKNHIQVTIASMWIVEQQPGEYNPIHTHTNCDISAVMYLKAPIFLPSEINSSTVFSGSSGSSGSLYHIITKR